MGDDWLVNEEINVDIQQLKDFAEAVRRELEGNFQPNYENGLRPMLSTQAPFGSGGMQEATFFRGRHDDSRLAVKLLMDDVIRGLVSLSTAAESISAEYLDGDAMARATNDDVHNAFRGVDGQEILTGEWQQDGGGPAGGGTGAEGRA
ncbi:hypothetical protein QQG74_30430 [Micromonospora sp. FIMYZ51]|uniref:hypothetical protein n=1 Tax=Micromonospora sp. FIMYZ51 TaxID=3051832 RepID=UPI00311E5A88